MLFMNKKQPIQWVAKTVNLLSSGLLLLALVSSVLIICFLVLSRATWGFSSWQPVWPFPLIALLVLALGAVIHVLLQVIKILDTNSTLFSKGKIQQKLYYGLVMVIAVATVAFMSYFAWSLMTDQPPDFFPFDDPEATYTVTKRNDRYMLLYDSKGDRNTTYVCDQMSGTTSCRTEVNRNIEVMIGNSDTELEPLVGKSVKITGDFVSSNKQCIAGKCQDIGNWAVLDIHSIIEVR